MSYLDDEDHDWGIEPLAIDEARKLDFLVSELSRADEEGQRTILQGYHGLKNRHPEATDEQCLDTSLIWWFG